MHLAVCTLVPVRVCARVFACVRACVLSERADNPGSCSVADVCLWAQLDRHADGYYHTAHDMRVDVTRVWRCVCVCVCVCARARGRACTFVGILVVSPSPFLRLPPPPSSALPGLGRIRSQLTVCNERVAAAIASCLAASRARYTPKLGACVRVRSHTCVCAHTPVCAYVFVLVRVMLIHRL